MPLGGRVRSATLSGRRSRGSPSSGHGGVRRRAVLPGHVGRNACAKSRLTGSRWRCVRSGGGRTIDRTFYRRTQTWPPLGWSLSAEGAGVEPATAKVSTWCSTGELTFVNVAKLRCGTRKVKQSRAVLADEGRNQPRHPVAAHDVGGKDKANRRRFGTK